MSGVKHTNYVYVFFFHAAFFPTECLQTTWVNSNVQPSFWFAAIFFQQSLDINSVDYAFSNVQRFSIRSTAKSMRRNPQVSESIGGAMKNTWFFFAKANTRAELNSLNIERRQKHCVSAQLCTEQTCNSISSASKITRNENNFSITIWNFIRNVIGFFCEHRKWVRKRY